MAFNCRQFMSSSYPAVDGGLERRASHASGTGDTLHLQPSEITETQMTFATHFPFTLPRIASSRFDVASVSGLWVKLLEAHLSDSLKMFD